MPNVPTPAALCIDPLGPYPAILPLDRCWDRSRDVRTFTGPGPVIAHPPCGPWGKYRHRCIHQDPALGPLCVELVRRFSGIIENPANSRLFRHCHIPTPGQLDHSGSDGFTIELSPTSFGGRLPKPTWLYIVGFNQEVMIPPPAQPTRRVEQVSHQERRRTPLLMAKWLVSLASRCHSGPTSDGP